MYALKCIHNMCILFNKIMHLFYTNIKKYTKCLIEELLKKDVGK